MLCEGYYALRLKVKGWQVHYWGSDGDFNVEIEEECMERKCTLVI